MSVIRFTIEYHTRMTERVCILDVKRGKVMDMVSRNGKNWSLEVSLPSSAASFTYHYIIRQAENTIREEWHQMERTLSLKEFPGKDMEVLDFWRERPIDLPYYSQAFTQTLFSRPRAKDTSKKPKGQAITIRFTFSCPSWASIRISGNQQVLGNWDPRRSVEMSTQDGILWTLTLDAATLRMPLYFKFLLKDRQGELHWMEGDDMRIFSLENGRNLTATFNDADFRYPRFRCAGCMVPLFSLRSEGSFGVGDFGDLKLMVQWLHRTHQSILQLLPVYDTTQTHTWTDSYPYNAISIYALHPMYMDIRQLPPLSKDRMEEYETLREELNAMDKVSYEAVNRAKWGFFEEAYLDYGLKETEGKEYQDFLKENLSWLMPYSIYSLLRDQNATPDFRKWPVMSTYDVQKAQQMMEDSRTRVKVGFYCWIQYHLHNQLKEASDYARSMGVVLKGDIPIGISPNSVEAWTQPEYFHFDQQAGAPPDDFSQDGQNWGFPTYNWQRMRQDGYKWWKERLRKMSEYFSAYRIDHILGFFRIWEIPGDCVTGLLGHFSPAMGLSRERIKAYGLEVQDCHITPTFTYSDLEETFGEKSPAIITQFFQSKDEGQTYCFKDSLKSQRALMTAVMRRHMRQTDDTLRMLYQLQSDVLFLVDKDDSNLLHPRIMGQRTKAFSRLQPRERLAYELLYKDYFYSMQDPLWRSGAMDKLPALQQSTSMLCCAEDLGMIPGCVADVMRRLQILSLEIERMPKSLNQEFSQPKNHPYQSVCTFSTHDMSTLRGWWQQERTQSEAYYKRVLCGDTWHGIPKEADGALCRDIIAHTLQGNAMITILALQDYLAMDEGLRVANADSERVNVPAESRHYWRYRMNITLEQLLKATELNRTIISLIKESNRDNEE